MTHLTMLTCGMRISRGKGQMGRERVEMEVKV